MKKFLLLFCIFVSFVIFCAPSFAGNVMPRYISTQNTNTLGLYQVSDSITLYKEPSEDSPVVHSFSWSKNKIFPENARFEDLFVIYLPSKNLSLMAVTDETEDWVEVIYNNSNGAKGWLKKDDPYKFMTWANFMNIYGRKYGLFILQDSPESVKYLKSAPEDTAQNVGTINQPQKINLNVIRGNFALVSVFDMDKTPKTGYIRWRANNGIKYYFPDIK